MPFAPSSALYLDLDETPAVESEEISPGVILDYNSEGKVTGIEPESAAADVDRSPQRPNALFVEASAVFAVGKSRGRAAGTFGCLLKFGSSGGSSYGQILKSSSCGKNSEHGLIPEATRHHAAACCLLFHPPSF